MKRPKVNLRWIGSTDVNDSSGNCTLHNDIYLYECIFSNFKDAHKLQEFVQNIAEFYYKQGILDTYSRIEYTLEKIKEETYE